MAHSDPVILIRELIPPMLRHLLEVRGTEFVR